MRAELLLRRTPYAVCCQDAQPEPENLTKSGPRCYSRGHLLLDPPVTAAIMSWHLARHFLSRKKQIQGTWVQQTWTRHFSPSADQKRHYLGQQQNTRLLQQVAGLGLASHTATSCASLGCGANKVLALQDTLPPKGLAQGASVNVHRPLLTLGRMCGTQR